MFSVPARACFSELQLHQTVYGKRVATLSKIPSLKGSGFGEPGSPMRDGMKFQGLSLSDLDTGFLPGLPEDSCLLGCCGQAPLPSSCTQITSEPEAELQTEGHWAPGLGDSLQKSKAIQTQESFQMSKVRQRPFLLCLCRMGVVPAHSTSTRKVSTPPSHTGAHRTFSWGKFEFQLSNLSAELQASVSLCLSRCLGQGQL